MKKTAILIAALFVSTASFATNQHSSTHTGKLSDLGNAFNAKQMTQSNGSDGQKIIYGGEDMSRQVLLASFPTVS